MTKILIDEATVKLALEALEGLEALLLSMGLTHLIVYGDAEKAITSLSQAIANEALDRMAENARELGLDYEPAQQEPAGWRPATFHRDNLTFNPGLPDEQTVKFWKLQGVEIEYCYTSPPAQRKPLTDEQILAVARGHYNPHQRPEISFARAIEAAHGIKEDA